MEKKITKLSQWLLLPPAIPACGYVIVLVSVLLLSIPTGILFIPLAFYGVLYSYIAPYVCAVGMVISIWAFILTLRAKGAVLRPILRLLLHPALYGLSYLFFQTIMSV